MNELEENEVVLEIKEELETFVGKKHIVVHYVKNYLNGTMLITIQQNKLILALNV